MVMVGRIMLGMISSINHVTQVSTFAPRSYLYRGLARQVAITSRSYARDTTTKAMLLDAQEAYGADQIQARYIIPLHLMCTLYSVAHSWRSEPLRLVTARTF